ncbi:MAG: aldo/keto reductase, partial [Nocardioidaceae bacterium]
MTEPAPRLDLNDGRRIPALGYGTYPLTGDEATDAVSVAIETGYRLIDTAQQYGNEDAVGRAVVGADVPREELFVTTKLAGAEHGYDSALRACEGSLERMGLDYVDLILIHWPLPRIDRYVDSWRAFVELRDR